MAEIYEPVKAPNRYFTIRDLFRHAAAEGWEDIQVRVAPSALPASCPVKSFHLGNCGDFLAVYLNLGEPGEAKD